MLIVILERFFMSKVPKKCEDIVQSTWLDLKNDINSMSMDGMVNGYTGFVKWCK